MELTLPPRVHVVQRLRFTRWLAGGLLAMVLLAGGWLWLRDSALAAVRQVRITGLRGAQAPQIEAILTDAARRMTTLDFDGGSLRAAVASFPVVKELHVTTSFPHGLRVRVIERPPVAVLVAPGERTAVAADGTVLGPALLARSLPAVNAPFVPLTGRVLTDASARAAVTILGAAPPLLARFVARVYDGPQGLTAVMRNGLLVYFGNANRPRAKWLSLARVLADPSSSGASYVDVGVPERPAAGRQGASNATPVQAGTSTGASSRTGVPDPMTAALAERLAATVGVGGTGSTSGAGESSSSSSSSSAAESASSPEETSSSPSAESSSGAATGGSSSTAPGGSSSAAEGG